MSAKRDPLFLQQRVALWHQNAATKAVARKTDKYRGLFGRRGCKAEVGSTDRYKLDDLVRIALAYTETHVREPLDTVRVPLSASA